MRMCLVSYILKFFEYEYFWRNFFIVSFYKNNFLDRFLQKFQDKSKKNFP